MSGNNTLIANSKIGEKFGKSCKERYIEIEIVCERDFQSPKQFIAMLTDCLIHWQTQSINHIQFKVPITMEKGAHILTILYQNGFGFLKFDDGCCVVFKNLENDAVVRVVQQQDDSGGSSSINESMTRSPQPSHTSEANDSAFDVNQAGPSNQAFGSVSINTPVARSPLLSHSSESNDSENTGILTQASPHLQTPSPGEPSEPSPISSSDFHLNENSNSREPVFSHSD
ncbi:uncharacterized protein LOC129572764 [Sitodiplosis mosellana]|nr:uncharacterized protein LOC129572764 [Sitodiplosis mosellana]